MSKPVFTHIGIVVGNDKRRPPGWQRGLYLRETKTFWVGQDGTKWRKRDGAPVPCERFPMDKLDVSTIVKRVALQSNTLT